MQREAEELQPVQEVLQREQQGELQGPQVQPRGAHDLLPRGLRGRADGPRR